MRPLPGMARRAGALAARTVAGLVGRSGEITDEILIGCAAMTSGNPARILGRADIGALIPGRRADVVVLDSDCRIEKVFAAT